jgi:SSS family transporter
MDNEIVAVQQLTPALGPLDFVIVGLGVGLLFVIAFVKGRGEKDTRDFFLGGRRVPTLVACLSFVATEVSAVTIVSVPATGFDENWQYLQFFIGSAASRILIAFLFIPVFYKYNCTTIYEFLKHRFGPQTQYAGSAFFFITRLLASGVRLYAACLGVSMIVGWTLAQTVLLFTIISILFIAYGGIKAVVWNGAYETLVFYGAGLAVIVWLLLNVNGGVAEAWRVAGEAGRLSLFKFDFNLNNPTTFWAGTANAFFVGLAVFGTDQELMQRLLTVETRKSSQKALIFTILAALPITVIYLAIGTLIFVFYQQHPSAAGPAQAKEIVSHFTVNYLPVGLKGLILTAIVLASIDSPLSSLSSSFVTDIYRPLIRRGATERHYLWVSRFGVIGFGIVLAGIALACAPVENVLWFAFQVVSVTGGSTLGIFLLGLLTKRRSNRANVVAMVAGALCMLALLLLSKEDLFGKDTGKVIDLAWSWLIVIGTALTFVLGLLLAPVFDRPKAEAAETTP